MRYSSLLLPSSLVAWVSAAPTVYLAGDSTMAPLGGKGGTEGIVLLKIISGSVVVGSSKPC